MSSPEDQARENIDRIVTKSGWTVQDHGNVHLSAYRGLAIRNFTLKQGHGFADCLLYVDSRAAGLLKLKRKALHLPALRHSRRSSKSQDSTLKIYFAQPGRVNPICLAQNLYCGR